MINRLVIGVLVWVGLSCNALQAKGQSITFDPMAKVKKPEKYENKKLPAERTGEKKFTRVRRFVQNNTTRYNYYFNASNKLNGVLEMAKMAKEEDFLNPLSFYPYTLEDTKANATELDSVIIKSTAGILLHDLRSDWVDNMYLLIGQAYYYRQDFDSAALTFQFINYNLQPKKNSDDDRRIIGSNEGGGSSFSIADKERSSIYSRIFKLQPSRNESLLWLARTNIDQKDFGSAISIINILKNDPNFPERLHPQLAEVTAYYYFNQAQTDSSAAYLEKSLGMLAGQDLARREYLLAQLFEKGGNFEKASEYYKKSARHTVDPVLEIYSELANAKMMRGDDKSNELENAITHLMAMAKKERFDAYRDLLYFSTAQLALQRPDTMGAIKFLEEGLRYSLPESRIKNRNFYHLANLNYIQRNYETSLNYYDSLNYTNNEYEKEKDLFDERKLDLAKLVSHIRIIEREDSLQSIAAMAPAERDVFIKNLIREYNKELRRKGGGDVFDGNTLITSMDDKNAPLTLFENKNTTDKNRGWYFTNKNAVAQGYKDFISRWGKREDKDNWRRKAAQNLRTPDAAEMQDPSLAMQTATPPQIDMPLAADVYDYDAMMVNLPLSPELLDSSNLRIGENLLAKGEVLQFNLEDHIAAIAAFEEYLRRFPAGPQLARANMGLYHSYTKLGNTAAANQFKNRILSGSEGSVYKEMLTNPAQFLPQAPNEEATKVYENVYAKYLEGNFAEAQKLKSQADSSFGKNYWTPQLLYIESVYFIQQRQDSAAISKLKSIAELFPNSPLAQKALNMADVVRRRDSIENYLTNLEITRAEEDQVFLPDAGMVKKDEVVVKKEIKTDKVADAAIKTPVVSAEIKVPEIYVEKSFELEPNSEHMVVMILNKVDAVYINESKNAFDRFNRSSMATRNITIARDNLDGENALLLFNKFEDAQQAIAYADKLKKAAPAEISWLPANKYSFLIISRRNLDILKENKDLNSYRNLLNKNFENRF